MLRFLGVPYPIRKHPQGFLRIQSGINQIKSDMLTLLLTNPGERVMLPAYGTPLRKLIFEPNDPALREKAKAMIANSIKLWEPRVAVQQIDVTSKIEEITLHNDDPRTDLEHILVIRILFVDPQNIVEVQELKLEIPLSGG